MQRDRRVRPGLVQAPAEDLAGMCHLLDDSTRTGQYRAGAGVEVLVQRDVNGVEQGRVFLRCDTRVRRRDEEAGAIQVHLDLVLPREGSDPLHLLVVERLSQLPPHGRFDGDRADLERGWPVQSSSMRLLDLGERERRLAEGEWDQVQMAE